MDEDNNELEEKENNKDLFPDAQKIPTTFKEILITGALLQLAAYIIFAVVSWKLAIAFLLYNSGRNILASLGVNKN